MPKKNTGTYEIIILPKSQGFFLSVSSCLGYSSIKKGIVETSHIKQIVLEHVDNKKAKQKIK